LRRKKEIEALIEQEEKRIGKFRIVEEEMDTKYPIGKAQHTRKHREDPAGKVKTQGQLETRVKQNGSKTPEPRADE